MTPKEFYRLLKCLQTDPTCYGLGFLHTGWLSRMISNRWLYDSAYENQCLIHITDQSHMFYIISYKKHFRYDFGMICSSVPQNSYSDYYPQLECPFLPDLYSKLFPVAKTIWQYHLVDIFDACRYYAIYNQETGEFILR